jgi:mannan endo-1,4-beta-mannosidase
MLRRAAMLQHTATLRRALPVGLSVLWLVAGVALWSEVAEAAESFIRVDGTRFVSGTRPFYFVGANLHVMHGPDARSRVEETIAAGARDGLTVGRVWALGEGLADAPPWKRRDFLFRAGPTGWQPRAFAHLDRVLVAAAKSGLRLIIVLSNHWADYGGAPMYLRWAEQRDVQTYGYGDRFFSDPKVKGWFVEHLERIVGRVNAITGVAYRDDPTILSWELQNELSGTPEAAATRRAWFVEMSRVVRRLDPNHLVVPGLIGYSLQTEREQWIAMNQLKEVSYCDQHTYPQSHLRSRALPRMQRFIDDRVQLAHHVIGKPIVFGEFGFSVRINSARARARWHERFLQRLFFDAGNGGLVWIYQPKLHWDRPYGILVDQPRDRYLRRALAQRARWLARRHTLRNQNPRLGPERGRELLAPTHVLMAQRRAPDTRWTPNRDGSAWRLALPVDTFRRAWFEDAGSWDGGVLVHAYGRRTGWIEYEFSSPPENASLVQLSARLSSEYPGASAPADGFSRVGVWLDDERVAMIRVPPDDGRGRWFDIEVDPGRLKRRSGASMHRLRFAVDAGEEANGVAIYGREAPLNREPVGRVGPLELLATSGESVASPTSARLDAWCAERGPIRR